MSDGWIGVDLDGCLAEYHGWNGGLIGAPVPAMVERVRHWLAEGRDVRIFTARVGCQGGYSEESEREANELFAAEQRAQIEAWCLRYVGRKLPVTCQKDFRMVELWDDRCVRVRPNVGLPCCDLGDGNFYALLGDKALAVVNHYFYNGTHNEESARLMAELAHVLWTGKE